MTERGTGLRRVRRVIWRLAPIFVLYVLGVPAWAVAQEELAWEFSCQVFPVDLDERELIERYGVSNVTTDSIRGLDDGPVEGTVVFPDSEEFRLEVTWTEERSGGKRPYSVRAIGTRWRTLNGVGLGFDLRTVEELNGWPFRIGGLDWESLGVVQSWGRGRFEPDESENCRLRVHFQPRYDGTEDGDLLRQVRYGPEYSSGHPALQEINPTVTVVRIYYPR